MSTRREGEAEARLLEALKRHHWSRLKRSEDPSAAALASFDGLVDYVLKVWKAGLDLRVEGPLAGTRLLDTVLRETGRRWATSVEEANDLYMAGMRMANHLWDELSRSKGDLEALRAKVDGVRSLLQKEYAQVE